MKKYGSIDILVNNPVTREGMKDLEDLNKADIERNQLCECYPPYAANKIRHPGHA